MTGWEGSKGRLARLGEATLWTCACAAVLTAHIAAASWLVAEEAVPAVEASPPTAIMIEFAEIAEAVDTEEETVSSDLRDSQETEASEGGEAPTEEKVEEQVERKPEVTEPQGEPERAETQEELPEEAKPEIVPEVVPDNVAVPLPVARPPPPAPTRSVKREEPRRKKVESRRNRQQDARKHAVRAQARVRKSTRTAARSSTSGLSVSSEAPARWRSRLGAHLERHKRYPAKARARREQGIVHVRFSIDASGNVLSVSLASSSGFALLDDAVLSLVRRASPLPPPPPGVKRTLVVPVRFKTR